MLKSNPAFARPDIERVRVHRERTAPPILSGVCGCACFAQAVARVQLVSSLGRTAREKVSSTMKKPVPEVIIVHKDRAFLDDVRNLEVRCVSLHRRRRRQRGRLLLLRLRRCTCNRS